MRNRQGLKERILIFIIMVIIAMPAISFAGDIIYTYDELNRLKSEKYPDGTEIKYKYDKLGNRTKVTAPMFKITAAVDRSCGGTISPLEYNNIKKKSTREFTMAPDPGYYVDSVESTCGGTLSGNTFKTDPVISDCTVKAKFAIQSYQLDVYMNTTGAGTGQGGRVDITAPANNYDCTANPVTPPNFTCYDAHCSATYTYGSAVTFTAVAKKNDSGDSKWYDVTNWPDSTKCDGPQKTCSYDITMNSGKSFTANFIQTFVINAIANSLGEVKIPVDGESVRSSCNNYYDLSVKDGKQIYLKRYYKVGYNKNAEVTATPSDGAIVQKVLVNDDEKPVSHSQRLSYKWPFSMVTDNQKFIAVFACEKDPPPAKIDAADAGQSDRYFWSLSGTNGAYADVKDGEKIKTFSQNLTENLEISKSITLEGGYGCNYNKLTGDNAISMLTGELNIAGGISTVSDYVINTSYTGGGGNGNADIFTLSRPSDCD